MPVAQLDRASDCGSEGRRFESPQAYHYTNYRPSKGLFLTFLTLGIIIIGTMVKVPSIAEEPEAADEISWQAPKSISSRLTPSWYLGAFGVVVVLIAATFIVDYFKLMLISPWLASAVILAGLGALVSRGLHQSEQSNYIVSQEGIQVDGDLIPYEEIKSFSIIDMPDHTILRLWPTKRFALPTSIVLDGVNVLDISSIIKISVPEELKASSVSDKLSDIIKF